jgi:prepilin-type N-terminal cleavage/methylation domain-containing protein
MKDKTKAFTLIELLVVVAIIGILAAIGLVTFSGFTEAAKANVVKSNHKAVVNFISASLGKCIIGDELKLKVLAAGFGNHFTYLGFKNPYVNISHVYSAVVENPTSCQDAELGYVCIIVGTTSIKVQSQYKTGEYLNNEIQR